METCRLFQCVFVVYICLFILCYNHDSITIIFIPGKPVLGQLVDDYLLDFDIFHVSHCAELLHYIDAKYLDNQIGGSNPADVDTWLNIQQQVDSFTISATKIAKRLATFVRILNQEDISLHNENNRIQEVRILINHSRFYMLDGFMVAVFSDKYDKSKVN